MRYNKISASKKEYLLLLRKRLETVPVGIYVNLRGDVRLKESRLHPRHKGSVARVTKKVGKLYHVTVPGSYPVGYKSFLVQRAEIDPCMGPLSKKINIKI